MTDHDDVLKDLDAALQVEPSRAFADGVRARVVRSQVQTRQMWWGLAAAASVGLAAVVLWRPSVETPVQVAAVPNQVSAPVAPRVTPEEPSTTSPSTPPATHRTTLVSRNVKATSAEPKLVVITNQPAMLRELWASYGVQVLRETTVEVEPVASVTDVKPPAPIAVDPIVVSPIVVTEIGKPEVSGGATPIIRRAYATKETR